MAAFSLAVAIPAEGSRVGIVSCLSCGAAVLLDPFAPKETDTVAAHLAWHETLVTRKDAPHDR